MNTTRIGRPRPHRRSSHRGRRRSSGETRSGRYSWARYYHPTLQRFISEDPIGFAGGDPNLYGYVGNNPTNFVDPSGLVVRWRGTQQSFSLFTAGGALFQLESDCVNGRRAKATVLGVGPGLGFSLIDISATSESLELFTDQNVPDPAVMNGLFQNVGATLAIPPTMAIGLGARLAGAPRDHPTGVSVSGNRLGDAVSFGAGTVRGFGLGVGFLVGSSTVISSSVESCKNK